MTEPHSESPPPRRPSPASSSTARGGDASSRTTPVVVASAARANGGGGGNGQADDVAAAAPSSDAARPTLSADAVTPLDRACVLWLAASQRMAGRAAHEVKNALNGVAVNLEVVRSRLARAAEEPGATPQPSPAAAARFAEVASAQFEALSNLADAMLALARVPREPADVVQLLAPLAIVYDAVARADGGSLRVVGADGGVPAPAPAPAVAVRLALAAVLDAAVGRGRAVTCAVDTSAARPRVHVSWLGAVAAGAPAADVVAAAADCGVAIAADDATTAAGALTIAFDGAGSTTAAAAAPARASGAANSASTGRHRGDAPPKPDQ
ncbi:MAG TPA: hypothetical protein VFJ74_09205 [Gemmatimonadaceae bacterium]|nr:hypothetical protein [Gemmatimonadaceae bacterium]